MIDICVSADDIKNQQTTIKKQLPAIVNGNTEVKRISHEMNQKKKRKIEEK